MPDKALAAHIRSLGDVPSAWDASFNVGDRVLWPNGVEGTVQAVDKADGTLMDECGGWCDADDVDKLA